MPQDAIAQRAIPRGNDRGHDRKHASHTAPFGGNPRRTKNDPVRCDVTQENRRDAETFVRDVYRDLHQRAASAAEVQQWVTQLLRGLSRDALLRIFMDSPEHQERLRRDGEQTAFAATELFDASWYLRRYRDVAAAKVDPLVHYSQHGWREDRLPNAYFDPVWYRNSIGGTGDTPALLHYARQGESEGRAPGPDFDPSWYRTAYGLEPAVSALADFLHRRHEAQVAPCARLWFVLTLPRTRQAGRVDDPFEPFLASTGTPPRNDPGQDLLGASGLFDSNFYVLHSSDVLEAGVDPLSHFCEHGWREGRQPNFYFNLSWYVATNPEVGRLAINPLLHYLLAGEPAGRRPIAFFDPAWYRQSYDIAPFTSPLAHYLANRRSQKFSPHPLFDPAWYMRHSGTTVHPRRDPFSHFLIAGMHQDVAPSPSFDPGAWRRRTTGRPSRRFKQLMTPERDNPLINYLLATYR